MTITTGPNLGLFSGGAKGEYYYDPFMRFLRGLDALVQPRMRSIVTALPTTGVVDGDTYLYTGADANKNKVARYSSALAGWEYFAPTSGWQVRILDQLDGNGQYLSYEFDGTDWEEKLSSGGLSIEDGDLRYERLLKHNLTATTNPAATNDSSQGYSVLSRWVNTATKELWLALDVTPGAANWQQVTLSADELGSAAFATVGSAAGNLPTVSMVGALLEAFRAFGGASVAAAGTKGFVPAPPQSEQLRFLRSDGAWTVVTIEDVEQASGINLGTGAGAAGLYLQTVGNVLQFKSLKAEDDSITLTVEEGRILIRSNALPGSDVELFSVGTGEDVYAGEVGSQHQFRSIKAGENVTVEVVDNTLLISAIGADSGAVSFPFNVCFEDKTVANPGWGYWTKAQWAERIPYTYSYALGGDTFTYVSNQGDAVGATHNMTGLALYFTDEQYFGSNVRITVYSSSIVTAYSSSPNNYVYLGVMNDDPATHTGDVDVRYETDGEELVVEKTLSAENPVVIVRGELDNTSTIWAVRFKVEIEVGGQYVNVLSLGTESGGSTIEFVEVGDGYSVLGERTGTTQAVRNLVAGAGVAISDDESGALRISASGAAGSASIGDVYTSLVAEAPVDYLEANSAFLIAEYPDLAGLVGYTGIRPGEYWIQRSIDEGERYSYPSLAGVVSTDDVTAVWVRAFSGSTSLPPQRSVDDGVTWSALSITGLIGPARVCADASQREFYILGGDGKIFKGTQDGQVWSLFRTLPSSSFSSISASYQTVIVTGSAGILVSHEGSMFTSPVQDGGWSTRATPIPSGEGDGVWLATNAGQTVLRSTDDGDSWAPVSTPLGRVVSIAFPQSGDGTVLATGSAMGDSGASALALSEDSGATWELQTEVFKDGHVSSLVGGAQIVLALYGNDYSSTISVYDGLSIYSAVSGAGFGPFFSACILVLDGGWTTKIMALQSAQTGLATLTNVPDDGSYAVLPSTGVQPPYRAYVKGR